MDRREAGCASAADDERNEVADLLLAAVAKLPETELQFFARRAFEESRLAKQARTAKAAAAHSYLAAAYSTQIAKELANTAELEDLLFKIE